MQVLTKKVEQQWRGWLTKCGGIPGAPKRHKNFMSPIPHSACFSCTVRISLQCCRHRIYRVPLISTSTLILPWIPEHFVAPSLLAHLNTMKTTFASLAALVGGASAFMAPMPVHRAARSPAGALSMANSKAIPFMPQPDNLDGTMAGDIGFDPLGLSKIDIDFSEVRT